MGSTEKCADAVKRWFRSEAADFYDTKIDPMNIPKRQKQIKLNVKENRAIVRQVKSNSVLSAPQLRSSLEVTTGKKVCTETFRRVLRKHGYHDRIIRRRLFVSRKNRAAILKFVKEHVHKGQKFWNNVVWSDETKVNLFSSDGVSRVWGKPNEDNNVTKTLLTINHGGGFYVVEAHVSNRG
ncbi:hypothetical protein ANN_19525 [Periplaneta americana]|uniref:Transposase Tc1-like domain-containing protein n=1 Tax=Periplaneta americana TaxID=6978 RepID=A0ABQ8SA47_PERAM|nr:hypothetical protein ANN_19525 [Periplaneta americana]